MIVKTELHSPLKSKLAHKFDSLTFSLTRMSVPGSIFSVSYSALYFTSKLLKLPVRVTFKSRVIEVFLFPFCIIYIRKHTQDIWAWVMILPQIGWSYIFLFIRSCCASCVTFNYCPKMNPCIHAQLIFDKILNEKRIVFNKRWWKKLDIHMPKKESGLLPYGTHKNELKMD